MEAIRRLVAGALAVGAVVVSSGRLARAEDVRDPASGVTFWAPDGWTSHTEASANVRVLKRTSPDGKAVAGLLVGEVAGGLDALETALRGQWRSEGASVEAEHRTELGVAAPAGGASATALRADYRMTAEGRTLAVTAVFVARGDLRVAMYVGHDPAAAAALVPVRDRVFGSLSVPGLARISLLPPPTATPLPVPAPPPAPVPAPGPLPAPPTPAPAGSGLLFDPAFREGRPAEALVLGGMPLLRGDVDAVVDAIEAGWDTALSAGEEQALRDGIESGWRKLPAPMQDLVKRATTAKAAAAGALSRGDAATAHAALRTYAGEWQAKAEAGGTASWADALRVARTRRAVAVAVAGEPPVSGAAMEALEALASFLISLARNDATQVTEGQRAAVREDARRTFGGAGAMVRGRYAAAHRLWLLVQGRWDAADAAQRLRARFAAVAAVRRLEHAAPWTPAHPGDEGLKGYARAAASTAAAAPLFDVYTAAFANPEVLFTTALEVAGLEPKDLDAALASETITLR